MSCGTGSVVREIPRTKLENHSAIGNSSHSWIHWVLARAAQRHQSYLSANIARVEAAYQSQLAQVTSYLTQHGFSFTEARAVAAGGFYAQLGIQSRLLSYIDIVRLFAYIALIVVPFRFIVKRRKPSPATVWRQRIPLGHNPGS